MTLCPPRRALLATPGPFTRPLCEALLAYNVWVPAVNRILTAAGGTPALLDSELEVIIVGVARPPLVVAVRAVRLV